MKKHSSQDINSVLFLNGMLSSKKTLFLSTGYAITRGRWVCLFPVVTFLCVGMPYPFISLVWELNVVIICLLAAADLLPRGGGSTFLALC